MSWDEILRRHAAALLRDLAAELEEPAAGHQDEPEPAEPDYPPWESPYRYEHGMCRNCGQPVQQLMRGEEAAVPWTHGHSVLEALADGRGGSGRLPVGGLCGVRGCRAASYDRLGEWDDALAKGWKAEPA